MEQPKIEELQERLTQMRDQDITEIDPDNLTELKDLHINTELPVWERVLSLIEQTGNPYAYLDNGIIVKISFLESGRTLQSCMEEYLAAEILPDIK